MCDTEHLLLSINLLKGCEEMETFSISLRLSRGEMELQLDCKELYSKLVLSTVRAIARQGYVYRSNIKCPDPIHRNSISLAIEKLE